MEKAVSMKGAFSGWNGALLSAEFIPENIGSDPAAAINSSVCYTNVKKPYLRNQREACCHKMFVKRERLGNSVLFHDNKAHRICVTKILVLILS